MLLQSRATLGRDAASLLKLRDAVSALSLRVNRLWVYASTQSTTDNGSARNQERMGLMYGLWGQYSSAVAWEDPEILSLGAEKLAAFQASEPGLAKHAAELRKLAKRAPHTLAPDVETALASYAPVLGSFSNARELLVNADITWPTVTVEGQPVKLSDTGYEQFRSHPDRAVRKQVFDTFW
jgi:oligoendopeptidase F